MESQDLVVRLPGRPSQVSRARNLVTSALGREHPLHDDCVLLTSELVTNAVLHSHSGDGGGFTLAVRATADRIRVCVEDDGSDEPPCACRTNAHGTSGRGLPIMEALSHSWGFSRAGGCNTVWFELVQVTVPAQWTR
ncbi:ATP-binding protein [Nonomuraea sp. NPDC050310]|uniref:ATP-binding protein n=1 Tax=unclassified Nonomuraea TaxID=2593643 RepID=UPI0033F6EF3A